MWMNLLEEIRNIEAKYGDELNSPVTDKELSNFNEVVLGKFPINEIPSGYKNFFKPLTD